MGCVPAQPAVQRKAAVNGIGAKHNPGGWCMKVCMRAMALVLVAVGCGGARGTGPGAAPAAGGERADISPVRGDLEVYTDGKGHMIALVEPDPERSVQADLALFYGDGKTMHAVPVARYHADGLKF